MPLTYRAAVLHAPQTPLAMETVDAAPLGPSDVLVRIKAAGLCHTDLEVIEGGLVYPMPIVLGHEAAGIVEDVGREAKGVRKGDHVVLSWNPHCGHCFYCDRSLPILCEGYLAEGPKARAFDGAAKARLKDGRELGNLMFLGAFGEYCIVTDQQAVPVPRELPFEEACLIGCGIMTGVGAALNVAHIAPGDTALVIGCGAVGLAAVQGARLAGAETILAADLDDAKLALARTMGATHTVNARTGDVVEAARALTQGRGADVVLESAGSPIAFRATVEAVRPGGEVIWLGKIDVTKDVSFRWGSLMAEKRIRRVSYGGARPARDFPFLARAALAERLDLKGLISRRIALSEINDGFAALKAGETIRSVVVF
ncbi:Zn-dependent alcohol dehydrogenase [Xanthobacter autotrophicus]|uniref:Zn-dependent alcohol dehydrogenase n=1 Tax=Xanthobacter autotrophicus TaxID=280 RepID=UPI001E474E0D|nr:Zn-dependent alcohol dehydrogenase [Xanthobacter autotrophicus]UDQ88118.1 Zn-dependent alcohol dehydrogenase [Xanthobacter autotrophicus]